MTGKKSGTKPPSASSRPKAKHTTGPAPLSEFQNLGNSIRFSDPSPSPSPSPSPLQNNDYPELIIVCTWLGGATPRRIAKYITGYRRLFPTSPVLVIQTVIADFTIRSEHAIRRNLAPAVNVIRGVLSRPYSSANSVPGSGQETSTATGTSTEKGTGTENVTGTGVLLHMFSNGGCHLAIQLAHSYLLYYNQSLPVRLHILDSSPGTFSVSQTYGAAAHSVPAHHPWLLQAIEKWGLWGAVVLMAGIQQGLPRAVGEEVVRKRVLGGVGVDFEGMRRHLLDERLWGGGDGRGGGGNRGNRGKRGGGKEGEWETGRLYLYSKKDEAVAWRDVERHIRQARGLVRKSMVKGGMSCREKVEEQVERLVRAERFEEASHCGLVMEDEERYWRAVRESWHGMMERRVQSESRPEGKFAESEKFVLGATNDEGEGPVGEELGPKTGGVEYGGEAREAEVARRSRTSKL